MRPPISTDNQHPLSDLNGLRKYIFTSKNDGEDFFLRVVTSGEEMRKYKEAGKLFGTIRYENQQDLKRLLDEKGQHLKHPATKQSPEAIEKWVTSDPSRIDAAGNRIPGLLDMFGKEDNVAVFILENAAGEAANVILVTINDPKKRESLNVDHDVGTLIFVSEVATAEKYKGKSLFSTAFDKVITMFSNDKRSMVKPIEYCVSITADTAVSNDNPEEEVEYIQNLPRYAKMWGDRLSDNNIQNRWKRTDDNSESGRERMPLESYLQEDGNLDELKIDGLIKSQRALASKEEKIGVRGVYLNGKASENYQEMKGQKKSLFDARNAKSDLYVVDDEKRKGWSVDGISETSRHQEERINKTSARKSSATPMVSQEQSLVK